MSESKRKPSKFRTILGIVFRHLVATVSFAIALYALFALFFSTDEERQLQRENRLYRQRYDKMVQKERLIADVLEGLSVRDNDIYEGLFKTSVPSADPVSPAGMVAIADSLTESYYLSTAASTSGTLMLMAGSVDANFEEVFRILREERDSVPPLSLPLHGMSYVQTGASIGMKYNPVYKLQVQHDGLDLVAPQGAPVYAVADGVVSQVVRSRKGLGNIVEIDHGNGYQTLYAHMSKTIAKKGQWVSQGTKIGLVGSTGYSTGPHLHFMVYKNGNRIDPMTVLKK